MRLEIAETFRRNSVFRRVRPVPLAFSPVALIPLGVVFWMLQRTFVGQEQEIGTRLEDGVMFGVLFAALAGAAGLGVWLRSEVAERSRSQYLLVRAQDESKPGLEERTAVPEGPASSSSTGEFPAFPDPPRQKARVLVAEDNVSKPIVLEIFAAALDRGLSAGLKTTFLNGKGSAGSDGEQTESEQTESQRALCKKTLLDLRKLGADMEPSFFPHLLETFVHDAIERLAVLESAIADGATELLGREAHALKGASLTIGALGMADICKQLESLGTAHSVVGATEQLARLEDEFGRVKNEINKEV